MKQIAAILVFFIFLVGNIYAQKGDTIRVLIASPTVYKNDSLLHSQENLKYQFVLPDFIYLEDQFSINSDNSVTFKISGSQKKNLFNSTYSKFIVPTALISYGILTRGNKWLQDLDHSTNHEIHEHYLGSLHIDDYSQFAPAVAVYGLDLFGIKAKHNFRDRTFIMTTSHILMLATVQTIKRTTNIERPDGSNKHSFPSGHTATAFVGAHILFKEYKDVSPWIGIYGYTIATGTGVLRVTNKKHWISDVVTGAGIGMLSVEIAYMLLPVFHDVLGVKNSNKSLVIAPSFGSGTYGVGLAYTF